MPSKWGMIDMSPALGSPRNHLAEFLSCSLVETTSSLNKKRPKNKLWLPPMSPTSGRVQNASDVPTKTPARTLIRVRNNQRRHRERRRQHIASLELRVQETEQQLNQALTEIATLRAELERSQLRNNKPMDDTNDSPSSKATPVAENRHGEGLERAETRETSTMTQLSGSYTGPSSATQSLSVSRPIANNSPTVQPLSSLADSWSEHLVASALMHPEASFDHYQAFSSPRCCSADKEAQNFTTTMSGTTISTLSISESAEPRISPSLCSDYPPSKDESTTPCVQAYIIISQLNFRGLDTNAITSWLYRGFRRPTFPDRECQVESKLLFELLDFISDA
ncbi:hypothetical protein H2198_009937 [Neophaeococcomyces mojaviensis]|uniref:Uncharacterized protein n=1 Tax=Neophaeococcomyces mojaviensis TaxID=3383035 RepID=A0ACC2ZT39_9EURO|nr:hypothetical protein H2198_009937 [Knufia sp. JES_112]